MAYRVEATEACICGAPDGGEHRVDCPDFEADLTAEELRYLRTHVFSSYEGFASPEA